MKFRFKNVKPNELFPILKLKKRHHRLPVQCSARPMESQWNQRLKFQSKNSSSKKDMVEIDFFNVRQSTIGVRHSKSKIYWTWKRVAKRVSSQLKIRFVWFARIYWRQWCEFLDSVMCVVLQITKSSSHQQMNNETSDFSAIFEKFQKGEENKNERNWMETAAELEAACIIA